MRKATGWRPDKPRTEWTPDERDHVFYTDAQAQRLNAAKREYRRTAWIGSPLFFCAFPVFSPVFWGLQLLLYNQAHVRPNWASFLIAALVCANLAWPAWYLLSKADVIDREMSLEFGHFWRHAKHVR